MMQEFPKKIKSVLENYINLTGMQIQGNIWSRWACLK